VIIQKLCSQRSQVSLHCTTNNISTSHFHCQVNQSTSKYFIHGSIFRQSNGFVYVAIRICTPNLEHERQAQEFNIYAGRYDFPAQRRTGALRRYVPGAA
jgi:hypothetical protein